MRTGRGLRNMERITDKLGDVAYEGVQQFISDSPWDPFPVFQQVTQEIDQSFSKLTADKRRGLLFDESGYPKKGEKSAGVARQYCGRIGKVDNCQIGVYSAMVQQDEVALNNCRLYLPQEWCNDSDRCDEAGIPEDKREFKTKGQIATEMAEEFFSLGQSVYWVGGDSVYGDSPDLKNYLDSRGQKYVLDISPIFKFYLTATPDKNAEDVPVDPRIIADCLNHREWKKIKVRQGLKGWIEPKISVKEVWLRPENAPPEKRLLIIKEEKDKNKKKKLKFSLSNFKLEETSWEELAWMQSQRFWVEQSFRNAKTELGMDDYQLRKWQGWYHHMALVLMAMNFLVAERIVYRQKDSLFTLAEAVAIMAIKLDGRDDLLPSLMEQIERNRIKTKKILAKHYWTG